MTRAPFTGKLYRYKTLPPEGTNDRRILDHIAEIRRVMQQVQVYKEWTDRISKRSHQEERLEANRIRIRNMSASARLNYHLKNIGKKQRPLILTEQPSCLSQSVDPELLYKIGISDNLSIQDIQIILSLQE